MLEGSLTNLTHSDKDIKAGAPRFFLGGRDPHIRCSHTEMLYRKFYILSNPQKILI